LQDAHDELTTLLRAIVETQHEIIETLAVTTDDIAELNRRITLLETASAVVAEAQQAQRQTRRLVQSAQALHEQAAKWQGDGARK
jgi:methyl-accepting chemotaxis protein